MQGGMPGPHTRHGEIYKNRNATILCQIFVGKVFERLKFIFEIQVIKILSAIEDTFKVFLYLCDLFLSLTFSHFVVKEPIFNTVTLFCLIVSEKMTNMFLKSYVCFAGFSW